MRSIYFLTGIGCGDIGMWIKVGQFVNSSICQHEKTKDILNTIFLQSTGNIVTLKDIIIDVGECSLEAAQVKVVGGIDILKKKEGRKEKL
jgi:hypothetical protein